MSIKVKIVTVILKDFITTKNEFNLPIYQVLHMLVQKVLKFQLQYGLGTKHVTNFYSFQSFQVKITFQLV